MKLFNVEVQVKVRAEDEAHARNLTHDYLASTINSPPFHPNIIDFDLLDEAVTEEKE